MKKAFCLFFVSIILVVIGYFISIYAFCNAIQCEKLYCDEILKFSEYYAINIRGHLFAGYLALGGFLLSLKAFIVVTMKDNVYDNQKYKDNWLKQKKFRPELKLYTPLKELSDFLYFAIFASILSAVFQMSIGLIDHWVASVFSIWSAIYAALLLINCLMLIKKNLDSWFSYLED
ncbi:hypothetical protein [uncultured Oxalicibacterium sp.]|uniref:hypothetical protein n=1 Tax=uncultured Oxalicibacterium sp. TaxID=1168540 RepID=UPI0025ECD27B|nr:hypothetical protein [uncultured Oxalicibacterium sp.]